MALMWAVIIVGLMFVQRPLGVLKRERGVSAGAPCCSRWATHLRNASFGHNRGVSCAPMAYFLTPHAIFLCGEDKYHKYGGGEFIIGGVGGVEHRAAETERYI